MRKFLLQAVFVFFSFFLFFSQFSFAQISYNITPPQNPLTM
jgi:hypothetical protein